MSTPNPQAPRAPGQEIVSINPATMEELGRAPIFAAEEIKPALAKARDAQTTWAALSYQQRSRHILQAKRLLMERQDAVCELIARETGKPVVEALASEVFPIANLMDYFARKSAKLLRDGARSAIAAKRARPSNGFMWSSPLRIASSAPSWKEPKRCAWAWTANSNRMWAR
jgi:acyl-CoA reductase-like NAD-dependent aldehyde dehydrogenase